MPTLELPVKTNQLSNYLPHRSPMVWVDEVLAINEDGGECLVNLTQAHYCDDKGHIRRSSYLEWMAQAYGYITAYNVAQNSHEDIFVQKAYLAGVKNFQFGNNKTIDLSEDQIIIQIKLKHKFPPIYIVEGKVLSKNKTLLFATAELKLFAE